MNFKRVLHLCMSGGETEKYGSTLGRPLVTVPKSGLLIDGLLCFFWSRRTDTGYIRTLFAFFESKKLVETRFFGED